MSLTLDAQNLDATTDCDREPIHRPERIQSHGLLLFAGPGGTITRVSANAASFLGQEPATVLGQALRDVVGDATASHIDATLASPGGTAESRYACTVRLPAFPGPLSVIVSTTSNGTLVEFEPASSESVSFRDLYALVRQSVSRMEATHSTAELSQVACEEVRRITGYDRAKVYRFDADWNGRTIAEDRASHMPSFLGLHFPASDIPAQARRLYTVSRLRQIPDIYYEPVAILPEAASEPLDLSFSILRSVSPVHVQYLKNMGVGASMSVSILRGGQLWGLIACHHASAIVLPFEVRAACDYLAQVLALKLAAIETAEAAEARIRHAALRTALLTRMAGTDDFAQAMANSEAELLGLTHATGAVLIFDKQTRLVGRTPTVQQVADLLPHVEAHVREDVFTSAALPLEFPPAQAYKVTGCGVLAINISRTRGSWVLWFRPEVVQTVDWAGDPRKNDTDAGGASVPSNEVAAHLSPRNSFEQWKQIVENRSLPWSPYEVESAREMRDAIVRIVLKRAEDMAALAGELQRSNKELEAFSYSVSHDLRAPFRHIVGYSELLQKRSSTLDDTSRRYLRTITDSARFAGTLVDGLLAFSQMSRTALRPTQVSMSRLVQEVVTEVTNSEGAGRRIDWRVAPLPDVRADATMLRFALRNLVSNAVKYSRPRDEAVVEIGCNPGPDEDVFFVRDNGVGFDPRYADKLFGVFQRLHRMEDFEGTGIGLANVRRTIERHGGRTWADGALDRGATFYFSLPRTTQDIPNGRPETDPAR